MHRPGVAPIARCGCLLKSPTSSTDSSTRTARHDDQTLLLNHMGRIGHRPRIQRNALTPNVNENLTKIRYWASLSHLSFGQKRERALPKAHSTDLTSLAA